MKIFLLTLFISLSAFSQTTINGTPIGVSTKVSDKTRYLVWDTTYVSSDTASKSFPVIGSVKVYNFNSASTDTGWIAFDGKESATQKIILMPNTSQTLPIRKFRYFNTVGSDTIRVRVEVTY
jgi:hypothetical protein